MENPVTEPRFDLNSVLPAAYNSLLEVEKFVQSAGIKKIQLELLKIRASQINGCAFCLNMHVKDALKYGEDAKRIFVLSAWREAPNWFDEEEKAILTLTEEITLISKSGLSDKTYKKAIELFGEVKTAQLIMAVVAINSWNRIAVSLNSHPQ